MVRLFIGTFVSQESRDKVLAFQRINAHIKETAKLRWLPPEKLHLTWNFLGDVPEGEHPEILAAMTRALTNFQAEQPQASALPAVSFSQPTLWPDSRQPRVFVLRPSETSPTFDRLALLLRGETAKFCRSSDEAKGYAFNPHVTIARTPQNERAVKLRLEDFVELKNLIPLWLEIAKVELICSHLGNDAQGYVPLHTFSVNKLDKA